MTHKQREKLAFAVMSQVGNLFEFWDESAGQYHLQDVDVREAKTIVAGWMAKLPGTIWDTRLGDPP